MNRQLSIILILITGLLNSLDVKSQRVTDPGFDKKIDRLIGYQVPVISVDQVKQDNSSLFLFLDAREMEEYKVSHIPGARHIGYDDFDIKSVSDISKDAAVIVYCSIGYRSDKIGGKLKKAGFTNVYNLYGSIFEWVNREQEIVDMQNQPTLRLHTYNKKWSKWVSNPQIEKVW